MEWRGTAGRGPRPDSANLSEIFLFIQEAGGSGTHALGREQCGVVDRKRPRDDLRA